jgi:hypothetical protein
MFAVEEAKDRNGGLLLATPTLSKIAPGLLGVVLLAQRCYRAAARTFAVSILLSLITWSISGWEHFPASIDYHLLRVSSSGAYDLLDDTKIAISSNVAAFWPTTNFVLRFGEPFEIGPFG